MGPQTARTPHIRHLLRQFAGVRTLYASSIASFAACTERNTTLPDSRFEAVAMDKIDMSQFDVSNFDPNAILRGAQLTLVGGGLPAITVS